MKRIIVCLAVFVGLVSLADAAPAPRTRAAATNAPVATTSARAARPVGSTVSARSAAPVVSARSATPTASAPVVSARAAAAPKAISTGTKITAATTNTVVSESCKAKYNGCMDSFCMVENTSGGRCGCSARGAELDTAWDEIQKADMRAYMIGTEGVEKIEMGADANEVIANVNAVIAETDAPKDATAKRQRVSFSSVWNSAETNEVIDDIFGAQEVALLSSPVDGKTGDALRSAADGLCIAQMPECAVEFEMLRVLYGQTVKSDCAAFENDLRRQQIAVSEKTATAEAALREAALTSLRTANKWDLGQCTIEFKKCMTTTAGCKDDFTGCVGIAAAERASNRATKDVSIAGANTKIKIAASTMDALLSKQPMCANITNSCVRVRDQVWNAFLLEAAPQLKTAELLGESNLRTSCISNISACFQKACRDTMDPNDPDGSYDMCLTNPDALSRLCKPTIDPCLAVELTIMDFVKARMAGMRVDACTTQVKEILQRDTNCGADYTQCFGLDRDAVLGLIHVDSLVACRKGNVAQDTDALADMIMGIMLGVDNSLFDAATAAVESKMSEICGSTTDCTEKFEEDPLLGTDGMAINMVGVDELRIVGLLEFGELSAKLDELGTNTSDTITKDGKTYVEKLNTYDITSYDPNDSNDGTELEISRMNARNVVKKITNIINMLASDEKIRQITGGRDMTQIRTTGDKTAPRFPNILDPYVRAIVDSGLSVAKTNHDAKKAELLKKAVAQMNDIIQKAKGISGGMCYDKSVLDQPLDFAR